MEDLTTRQILCLPMAVDLAALVDPATTVVVTSEIQNGVIVEESALPALAEAAGQGMIPAVARLVAGARAAGVQVVHATAYQRADLKGLNTNARLFLGVQRSPVRLLPGTPAVEVIPEVSQRAAEGSKDDRPADDEGDIIDAHLQTALWVRKVGRAEPQGGFREKVANCEFAAAYVDPGRCINCGSGAVDLDGRRRRHRGVLVDSCPAAAVVCGMAVRGIPDGVGGLSRADCARVLHRHHPDRGGGEAARL